MIEMICDAFIPKKNGVGSPIHAVVEPEKEWELIQVADITFDSPTTFTLASDLDGKPFELSEVMVIIEIYPNATIGNYGQVFGRDSKGQQILRAEFGSVYAGTTRRCVFCGVVELSENLKVNVLSNVPATPNNRLQFATKFALYDGDYYFVVPNEKTITDILIYECYGRHKITVYGVRA